MNIMLWLNVRLYVKGEFNDVNDVDVNSYGVYEEMMTC